MYAVLETGGKQYKVSEGDKVRVSKINADEKSSIKIDKVIAIIKDDSTTIGMPYVNGAWVDGKIVNHGMGKKVVAFHYKPKKRIRIKRGHRQPYTLLHIENINAGK